MKKYTQTWCQKSPFQIIAHIKYDWTTLNKIKLSVYLVIFFPGLLPLGSGSSTAGEKSKYGSYYYRRRAAIRKMSSYWASICVNLDCCLWKAPANQRRRGQKYVCTSSVFLSVLYFRVSVSHRIIMFLFLNIRAIILNVNVSRFLQNIYCGS